MPFNTILALVLITLPPSENDLSHFSHLKQSCLEISLEMELMDAKEIKYVFSKNEEFNYDIKLIQKRYSELKDSPMTWDSKRFPGKEECTEILAFNRRFRTFVEQKIDFTIDAHEKLFLGEVLLEIDELYNLWDMIKDTNCEYYYVTTRRNMLKKLKEKLGDVDFYDGALPPAVPLWRFQRIDNY